MAGSRGGWRGRRRAVGAFLATSLAAALAVAAPVVAGSPATASTGADQTSLYLVTLTGPGTARTRGVLPDSVLALWMRSTQDQVLATVTTEPVTYRWTAALSGFAVQLTPAQADRLATDPRVAFVEPNRILDLAATPTNRSGANPTAVHSAALSTNGGGAGTVIGFIDSGLSPDGAVFAPRPGLGDLPERYVGDCTTTDDWPETDCSSKVVGASWFVDGFGVDRIRDSSSLSARDDDGHGTAVASVAAGNEGLTARVRGQVLGRFTGVAPHARIAAYKACWTAPDPRDDGCAAADVVSAIDQATADGVDVLNISVTNSSTPDENGSSADEYDTVARALLGAVEGDIVVVGAAGNGPGEVANTAPWITTVGAGVSEVRRGVVAPDGAAEITGVMVSNRVVGPALLVRGADVNAPGHTRQESRSCVPGSLDAAAVAGRIVLCERGEVGRTEKSRAVRRADGVGMILANTSRGSLETDVHAVPTVHIGLQAGRELQRWSAAHPRTPVTLRPVGIVEQTPRAAAWSRAGVSHGVAKPDLLAPGVGVLAATPTDLTDSRWQLVSGTSMAAAQVSGAAAALRGRHSWSATEVASVLAGTATPVLAPAAADRARLATKTPAGTFRTLLGRPSDSTPPAAGPAGFASLTFRPTPAAGAGIERTVSNLSNRTRTFRITATGVPGLTATPATLQLAPGESTTVSVRVPAGAQPSTQGRIRIVDGAGDALTWRALVTR